MLRDIDQLDDSTLVTDICIIGAGAAGIVLACELDGLGARVAVLESGRLDFDERTQGLYRSEVVGLPHGGVHGYRYRVFGGSTTKWAGQALPLSGFDFERREWVPGSGWPFGAAELQPYYRRAAEYLRIPPFPSEAESSWPAALTPHPAYDPARVHARYSEFSPSPNFAQLHGERLAASKNVEVVLGANVTDLVPDPSLTTLDTVTARSLRGRAIDVSSGVFVLCGGGLETARVMLCSDSRSEGGVGNGHDLVGRFFQDHPGLEIGEIEVGDRRRLRRAFQLRSREGIKYAPLFSAADELQRAERIGHAAGTVLFGRRADSDAAAKTLLRAIRPSGFRAQARAEAPAAIGALLRDPIPVVRSSARRLILRQPGADTSGTPTLIVGGEQVPNPDSRVLLVDDRDDLGMRRLALDWRVTELDLRSWRVFAEVVASELERLGLGRVRLDLERLPEDPSRVSHLVDAGHHMGTARMADDPRQGVVDSQCRVHGIENLFLAGSSVFPTGGFSNPTFTILALTLRLSDRIRSLVSHRAVAHSA